MQAMVYHTYGAPDVLTLAEVSKPAPRENEVLVRVHAASINAADWRSLRADPFLIRLMGMGLLRPKKTILGADIAGRVEAVGSAVTTLRPGDAVFGDISGHKAGGFAEYVAVSEQALALKPANLSFEQAAAAPLAALTALVGLCEQGRVQPGQQVLIAGASGGVGTFAVQIARALGAKVTAVCSTRNVERARSLGAAHVVDYTREDFTRQGRRYDLILAVNGNRRLSDYRQVLSAKGTYVAVGGSTRQMFEGMLLGPLYSRLGPQTFSVVLYEPTQQRLQAVKELLETGAIAPVIDRCYPLGELREAFRYVEEDHAQGKVVITVAQGPAGGDL